MFFKENSFSVYLDYKLRVRGIVMREILTELLSCGNTKRRTEVVKKRQREHRFRRGEVGVSQLIGSYNVKF